MGSAKKLGVAVMVALGLCMASRPAHAAFINLVESFNGTTLDTATWESYPASISRISQDGSLVLGTPLPDTFVDYTTRSVQVVPGQTVRAEVTFLTAPHSGAFSGLFLTNNSRGTTSWTMADSQWIGLAADANGYCASAGFDPSGLIGYPVGNSAPTVGTTYTFELTWLSSTSATYNLYLGGAQLAGLTRTGVVPELPGQLYLSLVAERAAVRFDNVAITPEPTSITMLALGGMLLLGRRRAV